MKPFKLLRMCVLCCENKNIINTFFTKHYFATYIAFSRSIKIEIFHKI